MQPFSPVSLALTIFILMTHQITSLAQSCTTGSRATQTAGGITLTATLCADDDKIYLAIDFPNYSSNYFGIILGGSTMTSGNPLIYTTGKSGENLAAGLYAYSISAKDLASISRAAANDWTMESSSTTTGISLVYSQDLSSTSWTLNTASIAWAWAKGSAQGGLSLANKHASRSNSGAGLMLNFENFPTTTQVPTTTFFLDVCPGGVRNVTASETINGNTLTVLLCDSDESMFIEIDYPNWPGTWFGMPLGTGKMISDDVLIYTTGSGGGMPVGLYSYSINAYSVYGLSRKPDKDWTEIYSDNSGGLYALYKQYLNDTPWNLSTTSIPFGYASGSGLDLTAHTWKQGGYVFAFEDMSTTSTTSTTMALSTTQSMTSTPQNTMEMTTTDTPSYMIECDQYNMAEDEPRTGFIVRILMCEDDDRMYLDVYWDSYSQDWFGLVLGSAGMIGNAVIWTTGKEEADVLGLYAYTNSETSASGVNKDAEQEWRKEYVDTSMGIRIVYSNDVDKTGFSLDQMEMNYGYAFGSGLKLQVHSSAMTSKLMFDPATTPAGSTCSSGEATLSSDSLSVTLSIDCTNDKAIVEVTYSDYNSNWFGIVFSQSMIGNALIYTTGKAEDRPEGLYAYELFSQSVGGVTYSANDDFTEVSISSDGGNTISIAYEQSISKSPFKTASEPINVRWAVGNTLKLEYHKQRSSETWKFDLTGASSVSEDDAVNKAANKVWNGCVLVVLACMLTVF